LPNLPPPTYTVTSSLKQKAQVRQAKEALKTNKPLTMSILSQRQIVSFSLGKRLKFFNIEDARTRKVSLFHPRQKSEDRAAWRTPNDFVKSG